MTDIDSRLRAFRSTLDTAPAQALARAKQRALSPADLTVAARAAGKTAPARRWLAISAVASAVAVVAVVTTVLVGQSSPPRPTPQTAAELIESWARELDNGPQPPPALAGQTITVTQRSFRVPPNGGQMFPWDSRWSRYERDGFILVASSDGLAGNSWDGQQAAVQQQRASLAEDGPSLAHPTAAWLAALNPDPAALRAVLCSDGCATSTGVDSAALLVDRVIGFLTRADLVLPPQVRAGLLRLIGSLPGVTAAESTVEGHTYRVVGVTYPAADSMDELYLDPKTGRFVGSGHALTRRHYLPLGCTAAPPGAEVASSGPCAASNVPIDPPMRFEVTLWTQELTTP